MDDFETFIWQLTSQRCLIIAVPADSQEWTDAQPRDLCSLDEVPAKRRADCQEWTDAQPRDLGSFDEMPATRLDEMPATRRDETPATSLDGVPAKQRADSQEWTDAQPRDLGSFDEMPATRLDEMPAKRRDFPIFDEMPSKRLRGKAAAVKLGNLYDAQRRVESEMRRLESEIPAAEQDVVVEGFTGELSMTGLFWWAVDDYAPGAPSGHSLSMT